MGQSSRENYNKMQRAQASAWPSRPSTAWPLPTSHRDLLSGYSYPQPPTERSGSLLTLGLCSLNLSARNVLPYPLPWQTPNSSFSTQFISHLLQEAFSDYYRLGWCLF